MFDVSFGELLIIGAVTLIVVGPERMPKVARTAGMLFGRLQRFVANVKADLHQEMQMGELARLEAELRSEGENIKNSIYQPLSDAKAMLAEGAQMPPTAIETFEGESDTTPTTIDASEGESENELPTTIESANSETSEPTPAHEATGFINSAYRDRR